MAAVWITRFINATNTPIRVSSTDGTWRLLVFSRQLGVGEEITIPPQRLTDTTLTLPIKYQMYVDALNDVLLSLACGDPLEPLVR